MTWAELRAAPREIWVLCLLRLLTSFGYFSVCACFVLYLSQEHGYSDRDAAVLYGMCGFVTSLFSVATGPLIDWLGIRRSIVLGALIASVGMFTMALSFDRTPLLVAILGVIPIGVSLGMPVIDIGGKRFTHAGNRRIVYSLLYSAMNIGAALAGVAFDALRFRYAGHVQIRTFSATSERLLILSGACITCIAGLVAALAIRDIVVGSDGTITHTQATAADGSTPAEGAPGYAAGGDTWCARRFTNPARWYWHNMFSKRLFWQLMAFTTAMIFVRQIFRQFDTTFPKWALRVLGPSAPIGSFYAINPSLIVVLAPLCAVLLNRFDVYNVQIVGTLLSALSIFILASDASVGQVVSSLFVFTVAEAIYSPQTTTFVMSISPAGQEGTFGNLASIPVFMSTLVVGLMSGELVQTYCPAPIADAGTVADIAAAERRCGVMWIIIASVALITPFLLIALRCFIYSPDVQNAVAVRTRREKTDAEVDDF